MQTEQRGRIETGKVTSSYTWDRQRCAGVGCGHTTPHCPSTWAKWSRQDRDVAWRERGVADSSVPVSRQGRWVLSGRGRDVADHGSASPAMQGRHHLPATVQGPLIYLSCILYGAFESFQFGVWS